MKIKPKKLLGMMMTIIIIFAASAILYRNVIVTVEENLNMTIQEVKADRFELIWSSLTEFHKNAKQESDKIASNIEDDIMSLSQDELNQLQSDMDNNIINENFHNILMNNIENYRFNGIDNGQNGIIIMDSNGYLEDFNYRRADKDSDNNSRSWQSNIDNSFNKELEKDSIDKLLNKTSGMIATESYNISHIDNHIMIDELTYETLLNVFLKEGIQGLKNYQILVPHYITNVGDIFGNPDIVHGVKLENHKIIVVLEFNLYDQLEVKYQNNNNVNIEALTYRYNNLLRSLYIFGIILVLSVTLLILYLCSVYNSFVMHHELYDEENNNLDEYEITDEAK